MKDKLIDDENEKIFSFFFFIFKQLEKKDKIKNKKKLIN